MPLENQLLSMQQTERSQGIDHSDDEGEYMRGSSLMCTSYARPTPKKTSIGMTLSQPQHSSTTSTRSAKESSRRQDISDDLAIGVYDLIVSNIVNDFVCYLFEYFREILALLTESNQLY